MAFQYAGFPKSKTGHQAYSHVMPRVTSGYPVTGAGEAWQSLTPTFISAHAFSILLNNGPERQIKSQSDLCSTLLFLPQFLADGRKWTGEDLKVGGETERVKGVFICLTPGVFLFCRGRPGRSPVKHLRSDHGLGQPRAEQSPVDSSLPAVGRCAGNGGGLSPASGLAQLL